MAGYAMLDTGYWILDAGCWMLRIALQQLIVNFNDLFEIQPLDSPEPERLNIISIINY
jgi:hypothetical protein